MSRLPGPLCVTTLGLDWIDKGTNACTRHQAPVPLGTNKQITLGGGHSGGHSPLSMLAAIALSATPAQENSIKVLSSMREVQKSMNGEVATAPNYCLACARFVAAKLVGLIPTQAQFNEFLSWADFQSRYPHKKQYANAKSGWGWHIDKLKEFNQIYLPMPLEMYQSRTDVEFVHIWGDNAKADELLNNCVPLVVGVSLAQDSLFGRHHFIVLMKDPNGFTYAIDSWPGKGGVVGIPTMVQEFVPNKGILQKVDEYKRHPIMRRFTTEGELHPFSFKIRTLVREMSAGITIIPCKHSFFGYFCQKETKEPLKQERL